jgi:hypothetical protein
MQQELQVHNELRQNPRGARPGVAARLYAGAGSHAENCRVSLA